MSNLHPFVGKAKLTDIEDGALKVELPSCTLGLQSDIARKKYSTYLDLVHSNLDRIINRIEMHPIHREHDTEDRTSLEIVNALRFMDLPADHEASYGGNCDICINDCDNFIWLGEAKIDYSNTHLMEGFRQLSDRYATGDIRDGGLLIYCKDKAPHEVIKSWKNYLTQNIRKKEFSLNLIESGHNYFITEHNHKSSGHIFTVKHIAISLFDVASDKSARAKKSCSHTCEKCCPAVPPTLLEPEFHI